MERNPLDDLRREHERFAELTKQIKETFLASRFSGESYLRQLQEATSAIERFRQPFLTQEPTRHIELREQLADALRRLEPTVLAIEEASRMADLAIQPLGENLSIPNTVINELRERERALASAFRMPYQNEAQALFAKIQEQMTAQSSMLASLRSFLPTQEELARLVSTIRFPWVDASNVVASFESLTHLASLAKAMHLPPYELPTSDVLRTLFGDWSELTLPQEIFSDWRARQQFYFEHGFDRLLTTLPEPAFTDSLYQTGILRHDLFARAGAPITPKKPHRPSDAVKQRMRSAYDILFTLETRLREHIHEVMTNRFGPGWEKHRVPGDLYQAWKDKRREALSKGETEQRLLWYADFSDYVKVIIRRDNWNEVFKGVFRNETAVQVPFQRLAPLRIPTSHARVITKEDFLILLVEARQILKAIGGLSDDDDHLTLPPERFS